MSSAPKPPQCGKCGVDLATFAPEGLCPACLLEAGLNPEAGTIKVSPANQPVNAPAPLASGDKIGRYKILQQLGEGGCGVVYMAEQSEPVRRRVALKVIKLGMDTKQVIARFEAERQALALMDHPNIAKVHDAGATQDGRPYFVMELVRGVRITDYCDQNNLPTSERLGLFIQVCRAIQHAHQKGIIHRDIKPSNILVTSQDGQPVPKVIDFGIAKATTDQPLTDKTFFTAFQQFIGTPAYMSPEQADLTTLDIDTRSDIYSLGVLLYELLTGKTPFDANELMGAGLEAMRRTIREQEPQRPSTRLNTMLKDELTTTAKRRQIEAPKLINLLLGDLDWIVMRALEKDRTRRYETANGLATDIQRHLNNEPVVARPPSNLYRFQKLVRRNKLAFGAAGAVAGALVLGMVGITWQAVRATHAEQQQSHLRAEAQTEATKSKQAAQLLKDMLRSAGPSVARGRDATLLREILEKTSEGIGKEIKDQPEVQGDIFLVIGGTYEDIGDHPRAITNFEKAVTSYRLAFHGGDQGNLARALGHLGRCQSFNQDVTDGNNNARLGLEMARRHGDKEVLIECLCNYAASFQAWGLAALEGGPYLREALKLRKQKGDNPVAVASLMASLAARSTNSEEAEQLLQDALALHQKHLAPDHPEVVGDIWGLGQQLLSSGKFEEAEETLREALQGFHKIYDPNHPFQPIVLRFLAESLLVQGKGDEAESLVRQQLAATPTNAGYSDLLARVIAFRSAWPFDDEIFKRFQGDFLIWDLADMLAKAGKLAELEQYFRKVLELRTKALGNDHPETVNSRFNLASLLIRQGKVAEAETLYHEMAEARPLVRGHIYGRAGRWKEAAAAFTENIESEPNNPGPYRDLALTLLASGDLDGYRKICWQMVTRFTGNLDVVAADRLARACLAHSASGVDLSVVANMADIAVTLGKQHQYLPWFQLGKALAEYRQEHFASAAEWSQKTLVSAGKQLERDTSAYLVLGMAQARLKNNAAAHLALGQARELLDEKLPKLDGGDLGNWTDVIIANVLMREARGLIKGNGTQAVEASKADQ